MTTAIAIIVFQLILILVKAFNWFNLSWFMVFLPTILYVIYKTIDLVFNKLGGSKHEN